MPFSTNRMKNICPEIFRQRLIVEGKYTNKPTRADVKKFLVALSKKLKMTIIYGPVIKNVAGDFNPKHKGLEVVLIWAESGASLYIWDRLKFFTFDIYTCKKFDPEIAVAFTKNFFEAKEIVYKNV